MTFEGDGETAAYLQNDAYDTGWMYSGLSVNLTHAVYESIFIIEAESARSKTYP